MGITTRTISIDGLGKKQALVTAFETVEALGWRIRFLSDAGVIAYTSNSEFSWNGEVTVKHEGDVLSVKCIPTSNAFIDKDRDEQVVQQYIDAFDRIRSSITDDEVKERYDVYKKDFVPAYEDTLKPDTRPKFHFFQGFWSYFKPVDNYFFTPVIVVLNIIIFIAMVCSGVGFFEPEGKMMLDWGANGTVATLSGQWWRLLANVFLHFGIIHLALNMYALIFVGMLLEPFLGKAKFLTAYLLTGIVASVASLWWHDQTISAGASGAIFGLYGVFLSILSTDHIERSMRNGLLANIGVFVVYNLFYGSFKGGIDNAAHLGGLVSGLVIGYMLVPALQRPDNKMVTRLVVSITAVVMLTGSFVAYKYLAGNDRVVYYKRMEEFYKLEEKAVKVLRDDSSLPVVELLSQVQQGIRYWEAGARLIKDLDQIDLSSKIHHNNRQLIRYCQLRAQSYQLLYEAYRMNTKPDAPKLDKVNQQIRQIMDELSSR